jgi:hypothetical protein
VTAIPWSRCKAAQPNRGQFAFRLCGDDPVGASSIVLVLVVVLVLDFSSCEQTTK